MRRLIRVFEHERLTIHPDSWNRYLTPEELTRLYGFNDKNDNIYFTGIRDGIKFCSYVGVIQVGGLTLEILPKVDKQSFVSAEEYKQSSKKCHDALLNMLAACHYIRVNAVSEASLQRRYNSLLDLYFEIFIDEVEKLIRKGLIKRYNIREGNVTALKGRLDFGKNISENLIHRERFYTHHQVYNYDHRINQILYRALALLRRLNLNLNLTDRLARILLDYPEVEKVTIQKEHFEKIPVNRKTIPYQEALKIARIIILNYSPDLKNGKEDMLALLFDMNKLWEEYIYRMLLKSKPAGYEINFQNRQLFWHADSYKKDIKPDLVVTVPEPRETVIIDTKWKVVDFQNPGDNDLKQMYAYNMYWNTGKCILLYPKINDFEESWGTFPKGRAGDNLCKLGFVDVLDECGKMNKNIGNEIIMKIVS